MSHFEVKQKDNDSDARIGLLRTAHGQVDTPVFMPVGTAGAVKGIHPQTLRQLGCSIILANTYHMMLRPGVKLVEKLGGLHRLMAWDGPVLTDSGGYQIFSLDALTRIDESGVEFASHIDGEKIYLSPESAIDIQNRLGADIIMAFDQCTPYPCPKDQLESAVERTIRWARICRQRHNSDERLLFGIVQGEIDPTMRTYCAEQLVQMDFDGYAIGGLSVGEGHANMIKTVARTSPLLPENKPRYLMGAGTPADIIAAVRAGVDMFDCVLPTRNGRNAYAFTENGPLRMRNSKFATDTQPVEPTCDCTCCANFSRASIRHFFNIKEMLGPILLSIHNISFFQRLMSDIRHNIAEGTFRKWSQQNISRYEDFNSEQKQTKKA